MHNLASLVPKGILGMKWIKVVVGGGLPVLMEVGVHESLLRKEENHLKGFRNTMTHQKRKPENTGIIRLMNKLRSRRNKVCLSVCERAEQCQWVLLMLWGPKSVSTVSTGTKSKSQ